MQNISNSKRAVTFMRTLVKHNADKMNHFNLKSKESQKMTGQLECRLCKRIYFPTETSDEDNICSDCDLKNHIGPEPQPKRRISQRKRTPTAVKVENDHSADQCLLTLEHPIESEHIYNRRNVLAKGAMVQIHFTELLNASQIISNYNSKPLK